MHHALWYREIYSYVGVIECLSGMPIDVEFIDFEQVKNGISPDIRVIINAGDAYTSWSGAENWKDEKVVCALRRFVDEGGGFIGVGEPSAYQYQGRYFQLSDVLGVDRELGFSMSTDKYNTLNKEHFILEDIPGDIDFGEGKSRIYAQGAHYQILNMDGKYSRLVVNEYGKGRSVYFAGLPYSPQNCRLLLRAIYFAAHHEDELKNTMSPTWTQNLLSLNRQETLLSSTTRKSRRRRICMCRARSLHNWLWRRWNCGGLR